MFKIMTAAAKELMLLKRDGTGLLVLFVMPALLVIVITLVQENVMELSGQKKTQMLFLDNDDGYLGRALRQQLTTGRIDIVVWDKEQKNLADIETAVVDGDYQVAVIVPEGSTRKVRKATANLLPINKQHHKSHPAPPIPVLVFFDPGIMPGLRSGLTAQLQMALQVIAMEAKLADLDRELSRFLAGLGIAQELTPSPVAGLSDLIRQPLFVLDESHDRSRSRDMSQYNPVQQNVPAWALFGIFFTAMPIAGAILQERKSGIWIRLASLPINYATIFAGKIVAYVAVCLCQFLLIGLIGAFFFPYIGLPAFIVADNHAAVLFTVLLSSLAACGFGALLGMACNTYEQASTLGSTAVVAAAALGGVMVPVYAMPQGIQGLSILSPLNWGLTAFCDLLVRGYSLSAIVDDLARLTLFFLLSLLLAWQLAQPRR